MEKSTEKKLEELIELLKELLYKKKMSYEPRRVRSGIPKPTAAYRPRLNNHNTPSYRYGEEPKYNPKQERASYSIPKPWNEPMQYQPKERLVYDPEVKRILERIEKHLKPDAEEMLRLLEGNPELYDAISNRLLEKMNEDFYKQLEVSKPAGEVEAEPREEETKDVETKVEGEREGLEPEAEKVTPEVLGEERLQEEPAQEEELQPEIQETSHDTEPLINVLSSEPKEAELPEDVEEPSVDASESNTDVIEQIEAQDLSSLEAELYQEPLEPNVEPIEALEPEVQTEAGQRKVEPEVSEYGH